MENLGVPCHGMLPKTHCQYIWFTTYLTDRIQHVIINGETSEWVFVKAGLPQGSVLSPLLFLVYINDIVNVLQNCNMHLFSDASLLKLTTESLLKNLLMKT